MFNTQPFRQDIFANLRNGNVEIDQLEVSFDIQNSVR